MVTMIKLVQFAPAFGLPNASPFCMKMATCLRMAGLPFELVNSGDVMKAPKRKLPCIDDAGAIVADTSFIIDHLKARYGNPLDAALSPLELAQPTAFQRLIEENLYWAVVQSRWAESAGWAKTRVAFFGAMPAPLRQLRRQTASSTRPQAAHRPASRCHRPPTHH
jgi:glutathione S-transferase